MSAIAQETVIGTICHNDDNYNDVDHRRIEIWVDTDGEVWADRNDPKAGHCKPVKNIQEAVDRVYQLWGGEVWDLQIDSALDA